jgi:hypothetical protein
MESRDSPTPCPKCGSIEGVVFDGLGNLASCDTCQCEQQRQVNEERRKGRQEKRDLAKVFIDGLTLAVVSVGEVLRVLGSAGRDARKRVVTKEKARKKAARATKKAARATKKAARSTKKAAKSTKKAGTQPVKKVGKKAD